MYRISLVIVLTFVAGLSFEIYAQDTVQQTRELAASLDKTKHKKKEKKNMATVEVYVDVRNEPVVRDAAAYSGDYESEDGSNRLTLNVRRDGSVSGSGYDKPSDSNSRVNFTLKNASINSALLSATKVYENGEERKFEAVFVNRTTASGKNANEIVTRDTSFGLGFVEKGTWTEGGETTNWKSRIFLAKR